MHILNTLLTGLAAATLATLAAAPAEALTAKPTFSCRGALNPTERAICGSAQLADLDRRLSDKYWEVYRAVPEWRKDLRKEQRQWLAQRNDCGASVSCIGAEYRERLEVLADYD